MQLRIAPLLGFLVICAISMAPALAQQSSSAGDECFKLEGHEKQRECLETRARKAGQDVADAEAKILKDIGNWDQETVDQFQTTSDLAASTKIFEQYRTAQCELHASLAGGGNSSGDRRLMCEIAMNERRNADLQQIDAELVYWRKN